MLQTHAENVYLYIYLETNKQKGTGLLLIDFNCFNIKSDIVVVCKCNFEIAIGVWKAEFNVFINFYVVIG